MIILAFDIGTSMGIAVGDSDEKPKAFTERLGQAGPSHPARFSQALSMTNLLIKQFSPDVIAIEKPIAAGPKGGESRVQMAFGFRACILGVAHKRGFIVHEYAVMTIRKHFLGKGNIPAKIAKKKTIDRCELRGWSVDNDNEADACAVWDCCRAKLRLGTTETPEGLFEHAEHAKRSGGTE